MGNKYCSHGNTYNGDGTSSAAASSNGGVGAWNNLEEVFFDGVSYGSIDNDDIVYLRTSVSGTDVYITITADKSAQSYGAVNHPVFFVADDGTVWAGENGQITFATDTNNYEMFTGDRGYVWWVCGDKDNCRVRFLDATASGHQQDWMTWQSQYGSIFEGIETDVVNVDSTVAISECNVSGPVSFNNCNFRHFRRRYQNGGYFTLGFATGQCKMSGCYIDATDGNNVTAGGMGFSAYSSSLTMRGVKCKGFPAGNSIFDQLGYSDTTYKEANPRISFCDFGLARTDYMQDELGHMGTLFFMSNVNGQRNSQLETNQGYIEWTARKNYPYALSTLPDNDVWSMKVKNGRYISEVHPFLIGQVKKLWNASDATLKVTLNYLIKDTSGGSNCYDNIKAKHMWVCLYYTDASTGLTNTQFSPMDDSDLVSSSAEWLPKVSGAIAYGENSYNAYKIEIETDTDVRENTLIGVVIVTGIPRSQDSDYNFIDPNIQLEVV